MSIKKLIIGFLKMIYPIIMGQNYVKYYEKYSVDEKVILLESQHGENINGNIYYILKELSKNYKGYKLFVVISKKSLSSTKKLIEKDIALDNITFVKFRSRKYFKILSQAKYLFNDTSFEKRFIKKPNQIYLNTWHGTPLKTLGRSVKNEWYALGNIQKNFIVADYLLYPSEFMMGHMIEDYMLENICKAKVLLTGYPRNTVFFDEAKREQIRKKFGLEGKEVLAYMPTWRGTTNQVEEEQQTMQLNSFLIEIDKKLKDNQVLYVNLHPFVGDKINYNQFNKIRIFSKEYETYEFLSVADCLITDYSSVFFDFAVTKRKIILFTYDEEEYLRDRGMYLSLDDLPFHKVNTVDALMNDINMQYKIDYTEFIEKFAKYESEDVTKQICRKAILNEGQDIKELEIRNNNKKNVLMYVGNLAKNGVTVAAQNLLKTIDLEKRNYFITFKNVKAKELGRNEMSNFPLEVGYFPTTEGLNVTLIQSMIMALYKMNLINIKTFWKHIKNVYKYEIKRLYGDIEFDTVIQYNGYDMYQILFFSQFNANRAIYVHNDMIKEMNVRKIQHEATLRYAYNNYDKVVLVTEDMKEPTLFFAKNADNFYVGRNVIAYKEIIEKANKPVEFDKNTECNVSIDKLVEILENTECKKFINIGRFSPEKGHFRLINMFNSLYLQNKDIYLIIIGGHGVLYQETLNLVSSLESKDNIIIIKYMSNPYTVLKKADYFVLSSLYEGFGIVIAEADVLNKPLIVTDIVGSSKFVKKHNGQVVENSEEGIFKGMQLLLNGKVKPMNIDFEQYNKEAVEEFEAIFEKIIKK
ncbi:MAG: CDP-glycerol glycerophosphotransferase family protein [Oscillospiraceae bacterium]|nr:CDP-glycerol glycerophosphotransferase family protein [Oscillospiraceae bacterium]